MTEESKNDVNANVPINVLLAEDNESDVKITLRAFKRAEFKNNIYVVNDGQALLDFIQREGQYEDAEKYPRPDLILMDLNMPKINGFEVLEKIKSDPSYNCIPVVILTSSDNRQDVIKSYQKGAASYIQKPVDYEDFVKIVDGFNFYWHVVNKLPSQVDS